MALKKKTYYIYVSAYLMRLQREFSIIWQPRGPIRSVLHVMVCTSPII